MTAASGVAGLIKTALALHHAQLPPSLHFEQTEPSDRFLPSRRSCVQQKLADWRPPAGVPRRAGVSSFGVGGTNAHVVLEEAPPAAPPGPPARSAAAHADGQDRPTRSSARRSSWPAGWRRTPAPSSPTWRTRCRPGGPTSPTAGSPSPPRRPKPRRRCAVPADPSTARKLERRAPSAGLRVPRPGDAVRRDGSRALRDGADLPGRLRPLRRSGAAAARARPAATSASAGCPSAKTARSCCAQTAFTQPALFSIGFALASLWRSWGVEPRTLVGHSVGEFVAAALAEVFALEDAARLVAARGRLMQALPPGAMLSVRVCRRRRSSRGCRPGWRWRPPTARSSAWSLARPTSWPRYEATLAADGVACRRLRTSHAFHSSMMEPVVAPFTALVAAVKPAPPRIPIVSTATGELLGASRGGRSRLLGAPPARPGAFHGGAARGRRRPRAPLPGGRAAGHQHHAGAADPQGGRS